MTQLLQAWSQGDAAALERLWSIVYATLRRLARRQRRREYSPEAIETTALVHEAYLRLAGARVDAWGGRGHFFALAARVMRRILVDAARARGAQKRDGHLVSFGEPQAELPSVELLALDAALERLAALDPRQAQLVELRFFGGLTEADAASVLQISVPTLKRDWTLARAWLFRALKGGEP